MISFHGSPAVITSIADKRYSRYTRLLSPVLPRYIHCVTLKCHSVGITMTSNVLCPTLYSGTFIHCTSCDELEVLENAHVGVDEEGVIRFLERDVQSNGRNVDDITKAWGWGKQGTDWKLVACKIAGRSWFFPGFIGTCSLSSCWSLYSLYLISRKQGPTEYHFLTLPKILEIS